MKNISKFEKLTQEEMTELINDCRPEELYAALAVLMIKKKIITVPEINDVIEELRSEACYLLAEKLKTYEV